MLSHGRSAAAAAYPIYPEKISILLPFDRPLVVVAFEYIGEVVWMTEWRTVSGPWPFSVNPFISPPPPPSALCDDTHTYIVYNIVVPRCARKLEHGKNVASISIKLMNFPEFEHLCFVEQIYQWVVNHTPTAVKHIMYKLLLIHTVWVW